MGVSAVVLEDHVDVIGRDKIFFILIVHVFPFHDPEEGFGSVGLSERGGFIWGCSLLVNAFQNE